MGRLDCEKAEVTCPNQRLPPPLFPLVTMVQTERLMVLQRVERVRVCTDQYESLSLAPLPCSAEDSWEGLDPTSNRNPPRHIL